jgi:hypothetical protein
MYSVTPKRQNKLTELACLACFACGIGIFAASILNTSVPYLTLAAQICAVLLLTAGIYLYSKFIARTFTYKVQPGGIFDALGRELYDLIVVETVGNRKQTTVCRIALRDIATVQARPVRATKKNGLDKIEAQDGGHKFSYCVDMVPEKVIFVRDTDGNAVLLTYDAELWHILSQKTI